MKIGAERKKTVPLEFNQVARRYDVLTRFNPGYFRHLRLSASRLRLGARPRVLDLCCGSGISTQALCEVYPDATVVGLDASEGMLDVARGKPWSPQVSFVLGDATDPAEGGVVGPFDGILMAYGIRNVPHPERCLRNVLSLLAPGGVVCFHEYSVADSLWSRLVWEVVSGTVIIPLGAALSGSAEIYRYLRQSVRAFDGVDAFERRLRVAGFTAVRTEPMDGWQRGVVHSFLAERPR